MRIAWIRKGPHWDGYIGERKAFEINRYTQGYTPFCTLYGIDGVRQILLLNTDKGLRAAKAYAEACASLKGNGHG